MKLKLLVVSLVLTALTFCCPFLFPFGSPSARATSLGETLSVIDQRTFGTQHPAAVYTAMLDALSTRCTESQEKIGDYTVTGTKMLHDHNGTIDNFTLLSSVVMETDGRENLSCFNEIKTLSTLLLTDLL